MGNLLSAGGELLDRADSTTSLIVSNTKRAALLDSEGVITPAAMGQTANAYAPPGLRNQIEVRSLDTGPNC